MNTDAPWPSLAEARSRVLEIQTKLHRWATDGPDRRFDDLFNLVCDPAFLTVGWGRVRGNRGARTAGVDGVKPRSIDAGDGEEFLRALRDDLKARRFAPLPVRERMIPKASGKLRRLGIPTARDRAVQASLKLVLEPIFEADFKPCSYGFRPMRRAQDAIEEIHHFGRLSYEWILEGDIASCFDEISHSALMDRVRGRIADKRVLGLVKAFLAAGILSEDGAVRGSKTGTPQGGILSPCLANIALSVLDEHFAEAWETMMAGDHDRRRRRRRKNSIWIYDCTQAKHRSEVASESHSWLERLRHAIDEDLFVLRAQPIVGICANGGPRYELLLRMLDDGGGLIPPAAFIDNAERFDLIGTIDRWVLRNAVRLVHDHTTAGHRLSLAVNLSAKTMNDPNLTLNQA